MNETAPTVESKPPLARALRRALIASGLAAATLALAAVWLPGSAPAPSAEACGPFFQTARFWSERSTGVPAPEMVAGRLGILDTGVRAVERFVAYRHLVGPPLTDLDRERLLAVLVPTSLRGGWPDAEPWLSARSRWQPGLERPYWMDVSRRQDQVRPDGSVAVRYVLNCLSDAFATAAATLEARIATYGADSREVAEWVRGQDQVFANCSEGRSIPAPLDDSWPAVLRRDREYQIAAAYFYVLDYAEAERRFRAIGEDAASPWRQTARYLVARTQARDDRHPEAVETLRALLADPEQTQFRDSIRGLLDHYRAQAVPGELHAEKREELLASPLPADAYQAWVDFLATFDDADGDADLDLWIAAFDRRDVDAPAAMVPDAVAAWRADPASRQWLVAALVAARPEGDDSGFDDLLAAAATVDPRSPEGLTVGFHRARLLAGLGRGREAREVLEALLAQGDDVVPASRNRLAALRATTATDLDDFLGWSQMEPEAIGYDEGGFYPDDDGWATLPMLLTDAATELLNHLSTAELATVVEGGVLKPEPRRRVALAAWTRAVTLGDEATAARLAPLVAGLEPALAGAMREYLAADGGERPFVAVLALLRHPGLHPEIEPDLPRPDALGEMDSLRRNWWCPPHEPLPRWTDYESGLDFDAADAATRGRRAAEWEALQSLPAGPIYLGDAALNWADAHRGDPRVPEALHRVVRATRYGCAWGDEVGAVSRDAFDRLHRRYPDDPWTKRTPYWFD